MSNVPTTDQFKDHLIVRHSDGNSEKVALPGEDGAVVKIGRELDNNVVLIDPRSSRHHAEIRRAGPVLEIRDLDSANGTLVNQARLEPGKWVKLTPGQVVQLAETRLTWEKPIAEQSTIAMKRPRDVTAPSPAAPLLATPAPVAKPGPAVTPPAARSMLPWLIAGGAILLLLALIGIIFLSFFAGSDQPGDVATQPEVIATTAVPTPENTPTPAERSEELDSQSLAGEPTATATPSGPQLAIPVLEVEEVLVSPIIFGASPSTNRAYIFIDVRARNSGNIPFEFSISNFTLKTRDGSLTVAEAGSNTSENYLRQLGAVNRFENLALTPGGSVPGSLVFELEIGTYDLELDFQVPNLSPIVLGLGAINMDRELKLAAGTPLAALDSEAGDQPTPTPTLEPTPTPTRPALIPAPQVVARSALVGTIAYPVFNGVDFDIYFGDVAGGESRFFRAHASQPAFSPAGSRIAFHSWDNALRGIVTMDVSGAGPIIVGSFIEDQLPTWSADGSEIVMLSRRTGDRKSQLIKVGSTAERSDGVVIGEGEYPTIGVNDQLVFKGWGNTAFGLRVATVDFANIQTLTNVDEDTAPALSPDGQKIAFMSRREGNWDIYVVNIDGSNLQRLTEDPAQDGLPAWSPDGNALAFVSDRGGVWSIWVMTPDGKANTQLLTMPGPADGFVGSDTFASRGWAEERISWTKP
jgi:pSer/pThr/pTyr-binding forkhead associated (FHA) protein